MKKPADYILAEWREQTNRAIQHLKGNCPLIEDEVQVEMDKYIFNLERQNEELRETIETIETVINKQETLSDSCLDGMRVIDVEYLEDVLGE